MTQMLREFKKAQALQRSVLEGNVVRTKPVSEPPALDPMADLLLFLHQVKWPPAPNDLHDCLLSLQIDHCDECRQVAIDNYSSCDTCRRFVAEYFESKLSGDVGKLWKAKGDWDDKNEEDDAETEKKCLSFEGTADMITAALEYPVRKRNGG